MTNKFLIYFGLLIIISSEIFAQSDYRITQEFKSRQRAFEIAIEYAKTGAELDKIKKEINEFNNEFRGKKELLNRALYPNNFNSTFSLLEKKIAFTNKKLIKIAALNTKVTVIQSSFDKVTNRLKKINSDVYTLRKNNRKLMSELKAFRSGYGGSKESIDSLNNLIAVLKIGISQRDTLINEIMENIFKTAEHKLESLDDVEKKGIRAQIKNVGLIDNINDLINDNIEFLNASLFAVDDLKQLRIEFENFGQRWNHFGPKLFDIYSTDNKNKEKLVEIDGSITVWENSLNYSVWKSINEVFTSHSINLSEFSNGIEFENVLITFISSQIENRSNNLEVQKDQNYIFFAERVWKEIIKPEWTPILLENNLFYQEQIDSVDQKIDEWETNSGGSKSIFIYSIIILLAIVILVSLFLIYKKNKSLKQP